VISNSGADLAPRGGAALLMGAALAGLDAGSIGFVLPAMRAATGASAQTASWLLTVFVAATLLAVPLAGLATRRFGAVGLFRVCAALAASGALGAALADVGGADDTSDIGDTGTLLLARAVQGLGQGPLLPLAAAIVVTRWPTHRQGRWIGAISLAYGLAFLAAMVGMPLLLQWGWRLAFVVSGVLAVVTLVWLGATASSTARSTPEAQEANPAQPAAEQSPLRWQPLLQRETLAIAVLALGTGLGQAVLVYFPTLALQRLGATAQDTALLMLPLVAGGIVATVLIMRVMDRTGARVLIQAGALATLAGITLAAAGPVTSWAFMLGAGALGLGITGLCGGPLRYAAARALPASEQGLAQSAVALLTNLGVLGGSLLIGVLAGGATAVDNTAAARSAIESALLTSAVIMALSFVPAWLLRAHRSHRAAAKPLHPSPATVAQPDAKAP